jgi:hypothetical protein
MEISRDICYCGTVAVTQLETVNVIGNEQRNRRKLDEITLASPQAM